MRWVALLAVLLAGCDDLPRARSENEVKQMARQEVAGDIAQLENRLRALELQVQQQDKAIQGVRLLGLENASNHESLRKTFNSNVDQENEARAAAMTARGACGARLVTLPNGGSYYENIKCTVKDLR